MFVDLDRGLPPAGVNEPAERYIGRVLAEAVGGALSVDPEKLAVKGRGDARTAFARHIAIYIARTRLGLSFTAAGRLFDRDRTTVAHACRRVEERRDELWADELVEQIDRVLGVWADNWAMPGGAA